VGVSIDLSEPVVVCVAECLPNGMHSGHAPERAKMGLLDEVHPCWRTSSSHRGNQRASGGHTAGHWAG
jgi:hypothetical protein